MSQRSSRRMVAGAGAALAAAGVAVFANDKYALTHDLTQLRRQRAYLKRLDARMSQLGPNVTIYHILQLADPNAEALWFEKRTWTYSQLLTEVDKIATVLHNRGVRCGDSIAIFMINSPEMIFAYCALSKLGAVPALINTALRSQTLHHCMKVADAKLAICTPDLVPFMLDMFAETEMQIPCIAINLTSFPSLELPSENPHSKMVTQLRYEDLASITDYVPQVAANRSITDTGCLMFTSGTSGKPKAVDMKNIIFVAASTPGSDDLENKSKYLPLRILTCLPLFHATCLIVGLYYGIGMSSTLCLVRKFSASTFAEQLCESRATRMLYVGELCRYLMKPKPSKFDKAHQCIVAMGNGLQGDIWNKFRERYNIPEIREFYRSTEGIAGFGNFTNRSQDAGYVGRVGPIQRYFDDTTFLVKYDLETEEPWRDPQTGFCKLAGVDEAGEAIGRVLSMATYRGYLNNPEANQKKLIQNVFQKGDLFQRTGDLLVRNNKGMIKFADRSGDTYRWKGENVSAGEVREHLSQLPNVHDASVYGVKLESYDGQAGAAGITLAEDSAEASHDFMDSLASRLRKIGLTNYQMPRLVRLTQQIDTNATFKHVKDQLKLRPWDPKLADQSGDKIYWFNGESYQRLDDNAWQSIQTGKAKL